MFETPRMETVGKRFQEITKSLTEEDQALRVQLSKLLEIH